MKSKVTLRPILAAAVAAASLVGCTSAPGNPPTSPVVTSAASTSGPESLEPRSREVTGALAAYDNFWAAKVASQADPTQTPTGALRTYAIDKALSGALTTVLLLRRNGVAMVGAPRHEILSAKTTHSGNARVEITDCLDSSAWTPAFTSTGKSALAPGQSSRVIVESVAVRYGGRWVIKASTAHRDRTC